MTIAELRTQCGQVPFQPFVAHLADGRQIFIRHPDFVMFAPSGRSMIVYQPDDSYNVVDLRRVTDLEVRSNGESPQQSS